MTESPYVILMRGRKERKHFQVQAWRMTVHGEGDYGEGEEKKEEGVAPETGLAEAAEGDLDELPWQVCV